LNWRKPDEDKIIELLVGRHDFSEERIRSQIGRITGQSAERAQKGLGNFF